MRRLYAKLTGLTVALSFVSCFGFTSIAGAVGTPQQANPCTPAATAWEN